MVGRPRKRDGKTRLDLVDDPLVRSWHEAVSLRSELSADVNTRKLSLFLERVNLTPATLVSAAREEPDRLRDLLVRYAKELQKEGRLNTYIAKTLDGVRAFLHHHRVAFDQFPKLTIIAGESLRDERTPTPEELRAILAALSVRGKVIALLLAHSGLRPGVIGTYKAENGLKLRDLPELEVGPDRVTLAKRPFLVRVPGRLSKTRREYVTFGSSDLAEGLIQYLEQRQKGGESLGPDSPVVTIAPRAKGNWLRAKRRFAGFVTTKSLTQDVATAIRAAAPRGVRFRVYCLRAYCSTRLLSAESEGRLTKDAREEFMGHDLGPSGRYTLSKRLGSETIEELRSQYGRAERFLSTLPIRTDQEESNLRIKRILLRMAGYTDDDLGKLDLAEVTDEQIEKMIQDRVVAPRPAEEHNLLSANGHRQLVASMTEVEGLLSRGYEYVAPLGDERVVLRIPH